MLTEKQINIFIVDDNNMFAQVLRGHIETVFKNRNVNISLFETGEAGLEQFSELKPELVILDYSLNAKSPDAQDGLQVLEKLKMRSFNTSVIMLTSNNKIEVALSSFDQGASAYVIKTDVHFAKIDEAIRKIFTNRELKSQQEEKEKRTLEELVLTKDKKAEIERSKLIVEEKNRNITDSINYAKRIQQAKLPRMEDIYSSLPQSFVLFKPKDIVSGDFYFFYKKGKSFFLVAADCTGHGVPGAFMSMIGSEKLEDALTRSSCTSEILKHLNIGIKNSQHQTDGACSTRDGMDIAICSIDLESRIVNYSGANRPLWIIRRGTKLIEEIKGTKKAIGGLTEDEQQFESHAVKLNKGDTFYITTDGYADQFGGKDVKKLMTKKFKEILLDIQKKTMSDQKKHLDDFVENWKGEAEQVDDILVIGVRL
jgi:sigma-B regulation protein RsbU (phosphoserine phosphatase)